MLAGGEDEHTTGSQEALDRFHDDHSPLGPVRRPVTEEPDIGGVLFDFDPWN